MSQIALPRCARCTGEHVTSHCPLNGKMMVQPHRKNRRGPAEGRHSRHYSRRSSGGFWDAVGDFIEGIFDFLT